MYSQCTNPPLLQMLASDEQILQQQIIATYIQTVKRNAVNHLPLCEDDVWCVHTKSTLWVQILPNYQKTLSSISHLHILLIPVHCTGNGSKECVTLVSRFSVVFRTTHLQLQANHVLGSHCQILHRFLPLTVNIQRKFNNIIHTLSLSCSVIYCTVMFVYQTHGQLAQGTNDSWHVMTHAIG